jgi:hypothetical protein
MSNALTKPGPAKRLEVRGKLRKALDLMIWGNGERRYLPDSEAAVIVGMNVLSIRNALQKPHVLAYYKQQRQVLRERESPANIHRLAEIRDAADNMPAVQAAKALMLDESQPSAVNSGSPWLTIRVIAPLAEPPALPAKVIEHRPDETIDPWDATKPLAEARFRDPTDPDR